MTTTAELSKMPFVSNQLKLENYVLVEMYTLITNFHRIGFVDFISFWSVFHLA